jgi:hypothetical protein
MLAQIKRSVVTLALVAAPLAFLALPGSASAGERDRPLIRKGVFEGIWHTDPVTIIIERVNHDGTFRGEIHFDPQGRWGDVRAGFTGRLGRDESLTISRDDCVPPGSTVSDQIAQTGRPEWTGRGVVWRGEVNGPDFTSPFELRIPSYRR